MVVTFKQHAGVGQRFAQTAFDKNIGKLTIISWGGPERESTWYAQAPIVDAMVVDDGRAALVTVDVPEDLVAEAGLKPEMIHGSVDLNPPSESERPLLGERP